jgi:hypothetical protein
MQTFYASIQFLYRGTFESLTKGWLMLIIASRRSRKRSFLPEKGLVGRIAKTPENRASEPDFLQFPILQAPWESLKTKEFLGFSGRTL